MELQSSGRERCGSKSVICSKCLCSLVLFKSFPRFSSLLRTSFDTQKIARFYSEILGDVVFWKVSLKQVSYVNFGTIEMEELILFIWAQNFVVQI